MILGFVINYLIFNRYIAWISSKYSSATDMTGWSFIAHDLLGLFRLLRSLYELGLLVATQSDDALIFNRSKNNIERFMKCRDPGFNVLSYEPADTPKSSDEHCNHHGDETMIKPLPSQLVKNHTRGFFRSTWFFHDCHFDNDIRFSEQQPVFVSLQWYDCKTTLRQALHFISSST